MTPRALPADSDRPAVTPWEFAAVCAISALPALVKLLCYWGYPGSDDVFVHVRIAENIARGDGWGMDPHEPLSLSSSPLYTIVLVLGALARLDLIVAGKVISLVGGFLAVTALHRLLVVLRLGQTARLAGVVFAAGNIYLWRWNGTVMETTLALLFGTLAFSAFHRADQDETKRKSARYLYTGVLAGLAVLTRFEMGLLLPCFACAALLERPRGWFYSLALIGIGFAVVVVPWFAFSAVYFGALLPTPFYAKTSSGLLIWNPAVGRDVIKLVVTAFGVPLIGLAVLALLALRRETTSLRLSRLLPPVDLWLFPVALALFYYLKTPSLPSSARYFLPGLHILAAVFACVLNGLLQNAAGESLRRAVAVGLAVHVAVGLAFNQLRVAPVLDCYRENYWSTMYAAAEFLKTNERARAAGVLVEIDFGAVWYYAADACRFYDGGAVATPDLRGLNVEEKIQRKAPGVVIESLGRSVGEMGKHVPGLRLVWHRAFKSHSVAQPDAVYVCNIYENTR
jgi:hypothetical protein